MWKVLEVVAVGEACQVKPIIATFICDKCDYKVEARLTIGESMWPPDEIHLLGDGDESLLLCPRHYDEWDEKYRQENPNAVWFA